MLIIVAKKNERSWMVAGYPSEESVDRIMAYRKGLDLSKASEVFPKDYFHVTLRYWYGAPWVESRLVSWLEKEGPRRVVRCDVKGMEILGKDDSLVIRVASDDLSRIQKKADDKIVELGAPPSDFPTYKAHLTLAEGIAKAPQKPEWDSLTLDRWRLVTDLNGDEDTLWES